MRFPPTLENVLPSPSGYSVQQLDIKTFITLAQLSDVLSGAKSSACLCETAALEEEGGGGELPRPNKHTPFNARFLFCHVALC